MFSDEYFMKKALLQAQIALEKGEIPIGAVIVLGNKILAKGHNLTEQLSDVTAHAEMQAITSASENLGGKFLTDCTLFVTLEPCPMCAGALYWSRINRIVFATEDPKRGASVFGNIYHPKTKITQGVLKEEAQKLLQDFFQKKRNF